MVKKIGQYQIPFHQNGELRADYSGYYRHRDKDDFIWKDNYAFKDTMEFVRGDYMKSLTTGHMYPIYQGDMKDLLLHSIINLGVVEGVWTFVKRGTVYGIALLHCDDAEKLAVELPGYDTSVVDRLGK